MLRITLKVKKLLEIVPENGFKCTFEAIFTSLLVPFFSSYVCVVLKVNTIRKNIKKPWK